MNSGKIVGKIGFRYIEDIARPGAEKVERLRKYSSCNLSDGMNKMYTMDAGIRAIVEPRKIAGPAVTVKLHLGDNLMLHKALSLVKPGDVLVVDSRGCPDTSACGDIMMRRMQKLGVAGVIVDGAVRDVEGIREIGLAVYARAAVPSGGSKNGPGEVNFPVACGGVVVNPGDVVLADETGVVVIPMADIDETISGAEQKLAKEAKSLASIEAGNLVMSGVDDLLAKAGIAK